MTTNGQTRQLKKAFLEDFAETGNVSESARNIGIVRQTVYLWKERDATFLRAYEQAEIDATERLEQEARRRGAEGWDEPVFGRVAKDMDGKIGTVRKYSDTLLIFLLKGRAPEKYRERGSVEHTGKNGEALQVNVNTKHDFDYDAFAELFDTLTGLGSGDRPTQSNGPEESVDSARANP